MSHNPADDESQTPQCLVKSISLGNSPDSVTEAVPEKSASDSREYSARNNELEPERKHLSLANNGISGPSADLSNSTVLAKATEIILPTTKPAVRHDSDKAAEVALSVTKTATESEIARRGPLPVNPLSTSSSFMFEGMSLAGASKNSSSSDPPHGTVTPLKVADSALPLKVEATGSRSNNGSDAAELKVSSTSGTDSVKAATAPVDKLKATAEEMKPIRSSSMREGSSTTSQFDGLYEEIAKQTLHVDENRVIESPAVGRGQLADPGPENPDQSSKSIASNGGVSQTEVRTVDLIS